MLIGSRATSKDALMGDDDVKDSRFALVEEDNEYAIDPTHKEYRKVTQGHNKI